MNNKKQVISTGIFTRTVEPPQSWNPNSAEDMAKFQNWINRYPAITVQLQGIKEAAIKILREYGVSVTDDGKHDITPTSQVREECHDAVAILRHLDDVARLPPEQLPAVVLGFQLGRRQLMLNIRQAGYEPLANNGKKQTQRNRRINEQRSADAEVRRQERRRRVSEEIERQRKAGEKLNYQKAIELAAHQEGCGVDIIKKSVPNIWTPRRNTQ